MTADGFDNLRSLIDPKRRAGQGSGRMAASAAQFRPLGLALHRSGSRTKSRRRSHLLDAAETIRHGFPRCAGARNQSSEVARIADGISAVGRSGRNSRRPFRGRISSASNLRLPVAVESLRATRKLPPPGETITLSAADPLNLVGILVPGDRVPAISGRIVTFRDGAVSRSGSQIRALVASGNCSNRWSGSCLNGNC